MSASPGIRRRLLDSGGYCHVHISAELYLAGLDVLQVLDVMHERCGANIARILSPSFEIMPLFYYSDTVSSASKARDKLRRETQVEAK